MEHDHRVKWAGDLRFIGTGASGHSVVIDGAIHWQTEP